MKNLPNKVTLTGMTVLFIVASQAFAGPPEIEVSFHNSVDIASFHACSWGEGRPAPNLQVEETIHAQVEAQLVSKGYELVTTPADCLVTTQAVRDRHFPVGMLVIDIHDRASGDLAWRSIATGLVKSEAKQLQKLANKTIKKMFKQFPEARTGER